MVDMVATDLSRKHLRKVTGGRDGRYPFLELLTHDMVHFKDDFLGDLIADEWDLMTDTGGTNPAAASRAGGTIDMVAGATDEGGSGLALGLSFLGDNSCVMMARFQIDDITNAKIECGFTDAVADAGGAVDQVDATSTYTATSCGLFVFDTDATTDEFHYAGSKAGTDVDAVATGFAPVNDTYMTLVVACLGDAMRFMRVGDANNTPYDSGWIANMIEGGTLVTPWLYVQSKSASAHTLICDFVEVWQRREV